MEFSLDRTIEVLERTPGVLRALLVNLESWVMNNYGVGLWRAYLGILPAPVPR